MVAAVDFKVALSLMFASSGILALVLGFVLGFQNRQAKTRAAGAVEAAAGATRALATASADQINALAGVNLPKAEDIQKLLEALPEEDRAVGAFILGGIASFLFALISSGIVTLNSP